MKKVMSIYLSVACFGLVSFSSAFADIPVPVPAKAFEMKIKGKEATELSKSLMGKWIQGSIHRSSYVQYKLYRSSSGQTQIVCEFWKSSQSNVELPQDECIISKSKDGQPLPEFRPIVGHG